MTETTATPKQPLRLCKLCEQTASQVLVFPASPDHKLPTVAPREPGSYQSGTTRGNVDEKTQKRGPWASMTGVNDFTALSPGAFGKSGALKNSIKGHTFCFVLTIFSSLKSLLR